MKKIGKLLLTLIIAIITLSTACNTLADIQDTVTESEAVYVESMTAWSSLLPSPPSSGEIHWQNWIEVKVIPMDSANAETWYIVELQKMESTVQSTRIRWSQNELAARTTKTIKFYISEEELPRSKELGDIFSIRVHKE